jgi:signal transduction histidine kinase
VRKYLLYTCLTVFFAANAAAEDSIPWISLKKIAEEGYYVNHGFTKSPVRIGLIIDEKISAQEKHFLKLNNANINYIYLTDYIRKDTLYKTGDHFRFNSRPLHFWDFIFHIQKWNKNSDSLVLTMDKSGESLQYNLKLYNHRELDVAKSWELLLYGGVFTFSLIFTVAFTLLGIMKKEKHNFVFAAFIMVSTFWLYNNNGIWFQILWPNDLKLQDISRTSLSSLSIGFFIYYFITFYRKFIGPRALILFKSFIIFLIARISIILVTPQLYENASQKFIFQIIGTPLLATGIIIFLIYLFKFYNRKEFIFHNIGFTIYFIFLAKETLKLFGVEIAALVDVDQYLSIFSQFFLIAMFSAANIQQYRNNKKRKFEMQLEETHKRDVEISEKIIEAQEYERTTIGKNIHDQVGGLLSAMKIKMQTLKVKKNDPSLNNEMDQFIEIIDKCSDELHSIVDDLVPPEFEKQDFSDILFNRVRMIENATEIEIHYNPTPIKIEPQVGIKIYRIISELITNSIKHAHCTVIHISILKDKETLHINFNDNGKGIDMRKIKKKHGINNIHSRITFMNGTINTKSVPGKTAYYIQIPL